MKREGPGYDRIPARSHWFLATVYSVVPAVVLAVMLALPACGGEDQLVLKVGGIPDQDSTRLARRYGQFTEYLSGKLNVEVQYVGDTPTLPPIIVASASPTALDTAGTRQPSLLQGPRDGLLRLTIDEFYMPH